MVGPYAAGRLTGSVEATVPMASTGLPNWDALQAKGSCSLAEGKIVGFKPLVEMAGFIKLKQFETVNFTQLAADFALADGSFKLDTLQIVANRYTMGAVGGHNFRTEVLDYRLRITMPPKEWNNTGSADVQEWVNTAEPDKIGLTLWLKITGTLSQPRFSLDMGAMKRKLRENLRNESQEVRQAAKEETERIFGKQSKERARDWVDE
jgi:hypothetical protein